MNMDDLAELWDEPAYLAALKAVRPYFDAEPGDGTPDAAHFDRLTALIAEYERRHYPVPPQPQAAAFS